MTSEKADASVQLTRTPHWCVLLPDGWGAAVEGAAVHVDAAQHCCYVHGGRVAGQRGGVSSALYRIAFASPAPQRLHSTAMTTTATTTTTSSSSPAQPVTATVCKTDDAADSDDDIVGVGSAHDAADACEDERSALSRLYDDMRCSATCTRLQPVAAVTPAIRGTGNDVSATKHEDADDAAHVRSAQQIGQEHVQVPQPLPPPALRDHVLFRHGAYLVVHGGRDAHGVVQARLYTFHLAARQWECLHGLLGGCAAPRLHGHAVAPLDATRGIFVLMGDDSGNKTAAATRTSRGSAPTKRPRTTNDDDDDDMDDTCTHAANNARTSLPPLSVFVLHMNAFQRGWLRLRVVNDGPCARRHFALTMTRNGSSGDRGSDDVAALAAANGAYGNRRDYNSMSAQPSARRVYDSVEEAVVAYVVGGQAGGQMCYDAWRLCVATGVWRRIALALHVARSPPIHNSSSSNAARKRAAVTRPYTPLLHALLKCSSSSGNDNNGDVRATTSIASVVTAVCASSPQRRRVQPYSSFAVHNAGVLRRAWSHLVHDNGATDDGNTTHGEQEAPMDTSNVQDDDEHADANVDANVSVDGHDANVRLLLVPRAGTLLRQSRLHNAHSFCYTLAARDVRVPGSSLPGSRMQPHLALQQHVRLPATSSATALCFFVVHMPHALRPQQDNGTCNACEVADAGDAQGHTWLCCLRRNGALKAVCLP